MEQQRKKQRENKKIKEKKLIHGRCKDYHCFKSYNNGHAAILRTNPSV
ncbi:hypothetical protein V6N12_057921 [Hibiscus sabdariffa]|uniref:Uncharacterized protein n=1 Tax=Hibiscus sabdariffa TaxID=183260 RepID=A0ABR2B4Q8_9ROSI